MIFRILENEYISPRDKLLILTAFVVAIGLSIMLHEIAHGFVALKQGDYTAKYAGRLTLNPAVHFDFIGLLMFAVVGIGWAKPVPINPNNFRKPRKGVLLVSLAGVVMNLILAALCYALFFVFADPLWTAIENGSVFGTFFYYLLDYMLTLNLGLMAFNLLPIFPLDGFRIIENYTRPGNKFCEFMYRNGRNIFLLFVVLGFVADYTGFPYLDVLGMYMSFVESLTMRLFGYVGGLIA